MIMKKLITLSLVLAMTASQAVGIFAEENKQESTNEAVSRTEVNKGSGSSGGSSGGGTQSTVLPTVSEDECRITYNLSEGILYDGELSYKPGKELILKEPVREGYIFGGWYMDTNNDNAPDTKVTKISETQSGDITLFATWIQEYNITYKLNGGTIAEDAPVKFSSLDEAITPPVPTRESHLFTGWYEDNDKDGIPETSISAIDTKTASDIELIALWEETNKITYELDGGTMYEDAVTEFTKDTETIVLGTPTKEGYVFDGWYTDEDSDGTPETKIEQIEKGTDKNITLNAVWKQGYKITYELNGGINYENAPEVFTADSETIVLSAPTKENADFLGWYIDTDDDGKGDEKTEQIEKGTEHDVKLYAEWDEVYTITYVLYDGVISSDAPTTYKKSDEAIKLINPTRGGYSFLGWYTDDEFAHPIREIAAGSTGDITLYATWKRTVVHGLGGAVYYLRFNTGEGSKITEQKILVNHTGVRPENPTYKGYSFAGWYTDSEYTEKFDFDKKITKNTTAYAKWVKLGEDDELIDGDFDVTMVLTINSKEVKLNGKTVFNDVPPVLKNNRTMMPIRFIAENIGARVKWDQDFKIVTIELGERQIVIHVGSDTAYINGSAYTLDSPSYIDADRTYLPIRFVSEALLCEVDWNEKTQKVTITR